MSRYSTNSTYGYGFLISAEDLTANTDVFAKEVAEWIEEEITDPSDAYDDIRYEAEDEGQPISLRNFERYDEEVQGLVTTYLDEHFPLIEIANRILDNKGEETLFFVYISTSRVLLEFQKISQAKKPTSEEKAQLKEFRKLLGVKTKSDWMNASYIDYP